MPQPASSSSPESRAESKNQALLLRRAAIVVVFIVCIALLGAVARHIKHHGFRGLLAADQYATPAAPPAALASAPHYDVFVAGTTPSGVAAALAAARRGSKVLIVDPHDKVGGDIVYAMLNQFDIPVDARTQISPIAKGIFGQFYKQLGIAFPIDKACDIMTTALGRNPNITVMMDTKVTQVYMTGNQLVGARIQSGNSAPEDITFTSCVDATNNADVAAMAGAKFDIGREAGRGDQLMQSAGLIFSLKNCDWREVIKYVRSSHTVSYASVKDIVDHPKATNIDISLTGKNTALIREGGLVFNYAWERGDIIQNYVPKYPDILICSINFGHETGGTIVLNTLNILGVNGLKADSIKAARDEAVAELPYYVAYLRKNAPGLENAEIDQIAPELYIRETRHLHGVYMLQAKDVIKGVKFWDRIGMASYPLDLHPYKRGESNPYGPQRYYYTIPLRALLPRDVDGIFVASRCLSATWTAAGSARVIPATMAAGEGAGTAAWLCARENVTPHGLIQEPDFVEEIQQSLRHFRCDIGDKYPPKKQSNNSTLLAHQPHYEVPGAPGQVNGLTPGATPTATANN